MFLPKEICHDHGVKVFCCIWKGTLWHQNITVHLMSWIAMHCHPWHQLMVMTMKIAITLTMRLIMMIVFRVPIADWSGAMLRWCWSWWWWWSCWSWWLYLGADWLEVMLQAAPLIPSRLLSPPSRPLTHSHPPHSQVANTNTNTSTHSPPTTKLSSIKYKFKQSRKNKPEWSVDFYLVSPPTCCDKS